MMFALLLSFLFSASTPVDLYIENDVKPEAIKKQIEMGAPIHGYYQNTAILVADGSQQYMPAESKLIAKKVNLANIYILKDRRKDFTNVLQDLPKEGADVFYSEKTFCVISMNSAQKRLIRSKGYLAIPVPKTPIVVGLASTIPDEPKDVPAIHRALTQITAEKLMQYDQAMVDYKTRYQYAPEFLEAQDWSVSMFEDMHLETEKQLYLLENESDVYYYGLKQDQELIKMENVYKKVGGTWQDYQPGIYAFGYDYSDDGSRLFLCGYQGKVAWNTNANDYSTWTVKNTGVTSSLHGIFTDDNDIWAVGDDGAVMHSADGGNTWQKISLPGSFTTSNLRDIEKCHVGTGTDYKYFAVGLSGMVLVSSDGLNWARQDIGTSVSMYQVCGYESNSGTPHGEVMICGSRTIAISADGETWNRWNDSDTNTWLCCAYKAGRIWIGGVDYSDASYPGVMAYSDDYGQTFTHCDPPGSIYIQSISLSPNDDPNTAYICGGESTLKKTTDSGSTWADMEGPVNPTNYAYNVIAELPGETIPEEIVIVCAHEDSISEDPMNNAPGADDNASGAAAVLAIAEQMAGKRFERTVRFIHFSAEELGLLGSTYYAHNARLQGDDIIGVLNMDMIGYMDTSSYDFDIDYTTTGAELQSFFFGCGGIYTPSSLSLFYSQGSDGSDHAPFSDNGYQAIMTIEHENTQWNPYYHSTGDLPSTLDPQLIVYGTQLNLATAMELAGYLGERPQPSDDTAPYAYPNPLFQNKGQTQVNFVGLYPGAKIAVYDLEGNRILEKTSTGTSYQWSPDVASGIYMWHIDNNGKKYDGKLAVIK